MFLPFSHLFIESIGLPGSRKGIKSRVIETILLLSLIAFCVIGISYVVTSVFDYDNPKRKSVLNILGYYLPFLYSCISFFGVLFLLVCTPLGFAKLFTIVSNNILKPSFGIDELEVAQFEAMLIKKKIRDLENNKTQFSSTIYSNKFETLQNQLSEKHYTLLKLHKQSRWILAYHNLFYPIMMVFLLILSSYGIVMMLKNTLFVIFGILPTSRNEILKTSEMETSFFTLSILQTLLEIAVIIYFMIASLIGFYSLSFFIKILPKIKSTPMDKIILNCAIFLIFSSALPVSTKILGLTRFDLLGHFGDLHWLSNVYIIFFYNLSFVTATASCLLARFTTTVRYELYNRIRILFQNAIFS